MQKMRAKICRSHSSITTVMFISVVVAQLMFIVKFLSPEICPRISRFPAQTTQTQHRGGGGGGGCCLFVCFRKISQLLSLTHSRTHNLRNGMELNVCKCAYNVCKCAYCAWRIKYGLTKKREKEAQRKEMVSDSDN